jgi:hypothetical protein
MKRTRRTIAVVKIGKYGTSVSTHDYYMTFDEWANKCSDISLKGYDSRYINNDSILIIKKEEKES